MRSGLHLHGLQAETLHALFDGRDDWWTLESGIEATPWPVEDLRTLRYRSEALGEDPTCAPYLVHLVLDEHGVMLGRIGCHAGPDEQREVEIGYFVREDERGRGVGGFAVDGLVDWLRSRGVTRVRASVGPTNEHSRRILASRGFVETGRQIDDEDGLELIYSLDL